ncbi:MAG: hypothetical protein RQ936_02575 [Gammaproteobacteria bacterium]|nr:hypothetical protein [Gammaproteobacteria bacterium]
MGVAGDAFDIGFNHITVPVLIDIADIFFSATDQFFSVGVTTLHLNTEAAGVIHRVRKIGCIPHYFFRHTAVIYTGPAQTRAFDDGDFFSQFRRRCRRQW